MDWNPTADTIAHANLTAVLAGRGLANVGAFHRWSCDQREEFWTAMVERLGVDFRVAPTSISTGPATNTRWLPGAEFNIAAACLDGDDDALAVKYETPTGIQTLTVSGLRTLVSRCAGGLSRLGVTGGVRVGMAMPMTVESVVGYLAVVWAGGTVVSIADSFSAPEVRSRLELVDCDMVITQDVVVRGERTLPMYEKVRAAEPRLCIVVETGAELPIRPEDVTWESLLDGEAMSQPAVRPSDSYTNLLFSSGTTGTPKVIPWDQTPPIKAATDGYLHQDIHAGDTVAWPTNLGWMMGPWLIYASLLNEATIALSGQIPTSVAFCEFVARAGVNVLGVVPALVKAWRSDPAVEVVDWSAVRLVTSTGEASTPDDMRWLMEVTGAPVIEYCGGTEIGGGYLSSTVLEGFDASTFTTPCFGIDLRLFDEGGLSSTDGEVFLVPPSMGLSTTLLNRDHDDVYYEGVPSADVPLRRHGDQLRRLPSGHYRAMGRADDTMNLGGIKVSSAEIERVVNRIPGVVESAAVGIPPSGGGADRLVVFAVAPGQDRRGLQAAMQSSIKQALNPLFRISELRIVESLPRTASAKVMRRSLRELA